MVDPGTIVASTLVKVICDKLSSLLLNEFSSLWGVEKQLKALERTIKTVKLVLEDAEKCSRIENHVYEWLRELKGIVYDTDDLLDELYIKAQKSTGKNRLVPRLNFIERHKLAQQIESINTQLDAIASKKSKFHLNIDVTPETNIHISNQETWSIFDEKEIYGRNHEKKELISYLMEKYDLNTFSIISIIGLGGLGKTTLAQLGYKNEYELKDCFNFRMWIFVSQRFDCKRIVKEMIEQITGKKCDSESLESLGKELLTKLKGKKLLLVLDDVWNESIKEWNELKSLLINCEMGSKIIVTTRSERVSEMMEATYKINLNGLSPDQSRELFHRWAFGESQRRFDPRYLAIAEKLIKKCVGVPLALINLGSTMRSKDTIGAWEAVSDDSIWELGDDSKKVMHCLKLSYMHLPSYLKECFTFCCIFPKGKKINKLQLIGQWIAHGLIAFPDNSDAIEEKGNEYFKALVQRSFLQNVVIEDKQETCTMHDLVHDLARSILGPEFLEMKDEGATTKSDSSNYRYLSLINCSPKIKSSVVEKVRAVHAESSDLSIRDIIFKMKNLRSLTVLGFPGLPKFPICSNLIHVRYILIHGSTFTEIPDEIGDLWSLQALHLIDCPRITKLPKSIGNLIHLRTLELICGRLKTLPESISQCQNIRNLIIHSDDLETIPNSIGQLAHIQLFELSNCENLKEVLDSFGNLSNLRILDLSMCCNLEIVPDLFENLKSLERLDLSDCDKLKYLPESIGNLCNLRILNLSYCVDLESMPDLFENLKSLEHLDLSNCGSLKYLPESIGNLCNLRNFHFRRCGDLESVPDLFENLKSLELLDLSHCDRLKYLPESIGNLCNLRILNLCYCDDLESVPDLFENLKSLELLDLSYCDRLKYLPESIGNLCNLVMLNLNHTLIRKLPRLGEMKKLMYLHVFDCKLDCMPIGIGNLINLRNLRTFFVDSKLRDDCARISELKDMTSLCGSLEICGLQNLCDPIEAEHANLKHKQHLESLEMRWSSLKKRESSWVSIDSLSIGSETHENMIEEPLEYDWCGVLEALQPPSSIKSLTVDGYPGSKYPDWMVLDGLNTTTFPKLTSLILSNLDGCSNLPSLVNLSHVRSLELTCMKNLNVVDAYFPSLVEFKLFDMPKLVKVITMISSQPVFPRLSKLEICYCPSLIMQPHIPPSVVKLSLESSNEHILARTELSVEESSSQVPPSSLSVRELHIWDMKLTEGWANLGQLTSLEKLAFGYCDLVCLPNSMRQLSSLLELEITNCEYLHELPEWLGELKSLHKLCLDNTPLSILPRSMKDLTRLQNLTMDDCPKLERRYDPNNGEDRDLISHIPNVSFE